MNPMDAQQKDDGKVNGSTPTLAAIGARIGARMIVTGGGFEHHAGYDDYGHRSEQDRIATAHRG